MALIKCPECGNLVSSSATACPKYGAPVASPGIGTPLSTIQQTSKRLKVHIILSSLAFGIGLIWYCSDESENPTEDSNGL
ncbi:MAG: zinc-ribbon domain-containing protein [Mangrovibacterium sp.]